MKTQFAAMISLALFLIVDIGYLIPIVATNDIIPAPMVIVMLLVIGAISWSVIEFLLKKVRGGDEH